jgi:tRNA(Ile)-lysidine synthase
VNGVIGAVAAAVRSGSGTVYIGFSGGLDSSVLLHAAASLGGVEALRALHVNHQLHVDADRWEAHCKRFCAELGIVLETRRVRVDGAGSLEAAARHARYGVFLDYLRDPENRLLLAHHRGDQAETVLLRLLQGRGLYGMPEQRPLGSGRLLRPLLGLPRAALEGYAEQASLTWVEDPGNADETLDRNFLRHRLLPDIRGRWRRVDDALIEAAAERERADRLLLRASAVDPSSSVLPLEKLAGHDEADQLILLRLWLQQRGERVPSRRSLQTFLRQLSCAADRRPTLTLSNGSLQRYGNGIHQVPAAPTLDRFYAVEVPGRLCLPHGELRIEVDDDGLQLVGRPSVRFREGGEKLMHNGHHRSLKQLLQQARLLPWLRGNLPLVFDDLGLAAVPGVAQRDRLPGIEGPGFSVRWTPRGPFR